MALTSDEIKRMQREKKNPQAIPERKLLPSPSTRSNPLKPYFNIIREDINHLLLMFRRGYFNKVEGEKRYKEFLDQHFPGLK